MKYVYKFLWFFSLLTTLAHGETGQLANSYLDENFLANLRRIYGSISDLDVELMSCPNVDAAFTQRFLPNPPQDAFLDYRYQQFAINRICDCSNAPRSPGRQWSETFTATETSCHLRGVDVQAQASNNVIAGNTACESAIRRRYPYDLRMQGTIACRAGRNVRISFQNDGCPIGEVGTRSHNYVRRSNTLLPPPDLPPGSDTQVKVSVKCSCDYLEKVTYYIPIPNPLPWMAPRSGRSSPIAFRFFPYTREVAKNQKFDDSYQFCNKTGMGTSDVYRHGRDYCRAQCQGIKDSNAKVTRIVKAEPTTNVLYFGTPCFDRKIEANIEVEGQGTVVSSPEGTINCPNGKCSVTACVARNRAFGLPNLVAKPDSGSWLESYSSTVWNHVGPIPTKEEASFVPLNAVGGGATPSKFYFSEAYAITLEGVPEARIEGMLKMEGTMTRSLLRDTRDVYPNPFPVTIYARSDFRTTLSAPPGFNCKMTKKMEDREIWECEVTQAELLKESIFKVGRYRDFASDVSVTLQGDGTGLIVADSGSEELFKDGPNAVMREFDLGRIKLLPGSDSYVAKIETSVYQIVREFDFDYPGTQYLDIQKAKPGDSIVITLKKNNGPAAESDLVVVLRGSGLGKAVFSPLFGNPIYERRTDPDNTQCKKTGQTEVTCRIRNVFVSTDSGTPVIWLASITADSGHEIVSITPQPQTVRDAMLRTADETRFPIESVNASLDTGVEGERTITIEFRVKDPVPTPTPPVTPEIIKILPF